MEMLLALLALVCGIVALCRINATQRQMGQQRDDLDLLQERLSRLEQGTSKGGLCVQAVARDTPLPVTLPELQAEPEPVTPLPDVPALVLPPKPPAPPKPVPEPIEGVSVSTQSIQINKDRLGQLEKILGLRWTTWVGGLVLFLGAALFVKYAFDQRWLGEGARVGLGIFSGIIVAILGECSLRRQMTALGQGLLGVGLAIVYVSLFGAYARYDLMPQPLAFVCLTLVTVVGMGLAVWHNAIAISFLALLGGFLTPILLPKEKDSRDLLFSYLLLLDLGVLVVAWFKKWRALDILAFVGTSLVFTIWYLNVYDSTEFNTAATVVWLVSFYLVFLLNPFLYHLRQGTCVTGERFFLAVANAVSMFGWSYRLLCPEHRTLMGLMTLAMSLAYLSLAVLTRCRVPKDQRAVLGFSGLFMALLFLVAPVCLSLHAVTLVWAIQAPLLLYLAYKYDYLPVRLGSLVPFLLAVGRLFIWCRPWHEAEFTPVFNATFMTAALVVLAGFAYTWLHHRHRMRATLWDRQLQTIIGIGSGFLFLVCLHVEINAWLISISMADHRFWICALIWSAGCVGFAGAGIKLHQLAVFASSAVSLALALMLCILAYDPQKDVAWVFLNGRFLVSGLIVAQLMVLGTVCYRLQRLTWPQQLHAVQWCWGLASFAISGLLTIECHLWLPGHGYGALAWCLYPVWWLIGAVVTAAVGGKGGFDRLRLLPLVFLGLAESCCLYSYFGLELPVSMVFLNLHFVTALLVSLALLAYSLWIWRCPVPLISSQTSFLQALFANSIVALFLLLNMEIHTVLSQLIENPETARWVIQMALSITWGLFATSLLVIGFWRRLRVLRLAALGLFGVTAFKLVLVDLARAEEIYRIVSFIGLGLLMIAASYLYHRVEKRLSNCEGADRSQDKEEAASD